MASIAGLPFFSMLALIAALGAASPSPPPAPDQPAGSLFVSTLPAGADVWIDGTYIGHSPALASALPVGKHNITLSKTGWALRELVVEVRPAETALSAVRLSAKTPHPGAARATGNYVLRGVPRGATVLVDGLAVRSLGPAALSAGEHRVALVTARGRTTLAFEVVPETTTEVLLREPAGAEARSGVVAPVDRYLPVGVCAVEGKKIVVRYAGHVVVARFGENDVRYDGTLVSYAGTPESIGGKLYLPLELLQRLSAKPEPARTR